jgi:3-oxoacyl-[acyl-carrier-protein] synthase III
VPFGILGTGSAFPDRILTNQDLEKIVETNDEWIRTRTGICERRMAEPEIATSDLAARAGAKAIAEAGLTPADIDLVIVATFTPDHFTPSTACLVHGKLNIPNCMAFDVNAACTGWIYALSCANGLLTTGMAKKALVIGADCVTRLTNFKDRTTCVLFGDAAGAVVLGEVEEGRGILSQFCSADGRQGQYIIVPGGGSRNPCSHEVVDKDEQFLQMSGNDVFKFAATTLPEAVNIAVDRAGLKIDDLDWIIPHQANLRIIDNAVKRLHVPHEKFIINIDRFGNTSAASIGVALDEAVGDGRVKPGQLICLVAFGGGLTWGASVIRL